MERQVLRDLPGNLAGLLTEYAFNAEAIDADLS